MRLRIEHTTHYHYGEPLRHAVQTLRLTPCDSAHQTVEQWRVQGAGPLYDSVDGYGNRMHTCTLPPRAMQASVSVQGVVNTHASPWLVDDAALPPPWIYLRPTPLACAHEPLYRFAKDALGLQRSDESALLALAEAVCRQVAYEPGHTGVHTTAPQAFDHGKGVCQDQAHVFIAACRSLGLPARYVSGYFHAAGAPELASHAWADVCVDLQARRWLSIDVTHHCLIDERHVRLAVGPDYAACPPVRGVRSGGGEERMEVELRVQPLDA